MPKSKDALYQVEVITGARRLYVPTRTIEQDEDGNGKVPRRRYKKSKWEYLVKWHGYGSDENSWEPEKNFRAGCEYLLASFWEHAPIGKDDKVYAGFRIDAEKEWIEKELKRFHYLQKLKSRNDQKKSQKRYKSTYGRPSEVSVEVSDHVVQTSSSSNSSTISAAEDSDSDNEPSISKRKLEDTIDISERPLVIKIPPQKKIKPNIPASTVETEVEPKGVSLSDFSLENPQLPEQQSNVATTDEEEPPPFPSFSEPESQVAPESPPLLHEPLPPASLNKSPVTISQGLHPLDSQAQDVFPESTSTNVSNEPRISTKQRLSFGALALRPPKVISSTVSGSRNQVSSKATYARFMPLGFKKGIVQTSSMAIGGYPWLPEPTLSSINALPSPSTQDDLDVESSQTPRIQDHNMTGQVEDEFLEDLMFRKLASFTNVLKSAEECPVESLQAQSPISEHLPTSKLPQKSWSWSGDVFTGTNPSKPVFGITINGVAPIVVKGPNFSDLLVCMEHLFFSSFYDTVDFDSILPACQEIRQFATLDPRSSADVESFDLFCTYMAKMHKINLLPIILDGSTIGHMMVFHHNTVSVTSRLEIPLDIQKGRGLAAALVLWTLSKSQLSGRSRCSNHPNQHLSSKTDMEPLLDDRSLWLRSIRTRSHYHHGLRILEFPRILHHYLCDNVHERTYSVWYEGGDGTRKRFGIETRALYGILDKCGCKRSRIQEARIIFIHVGAIKYLHKLPGFLDICSTSFSVQLYTYGSHETISRKLWGIREIYPCGGIVTFTPQALLDDIPGVIHRIAQIQRHPLWECYIMPSVIGMAVTLYSQREGSDPISDFDRGRLPYITLLTAIEDGEVALISSPPNHNSCSKKDVDEWVEKFWMHRPGDFRATIQACLDAFSHRYPGFPPTHLTSAILDEISEDLRCMRTQPVFMENYRRYVVLDSPRAWRETREDALEWTSTTKFDFKDEFFPTQECV